MMQSTIRERSTNTTQTSRSLYADAVQNRSGDAIVQLMPYAFIQRSIAHKRKVANFSHPVPTNLADINITDNLQFSTNSDYSVLHDSNAYDIDLIIMLAKVRNMDILRECIVFSR
jgi:hypothetical protein